MLVDSCELESLGEEVCSPIRLSVTQPLAAVVQSAFQRLAHDSSDCEAIHVIAFGKLDAGDPESCLEFLQSHPVALEGNATGNRLAGYACLSLDDLTAAQEALDHAVGLNPHLCDCWIWLGKIARQSGEVDQAATCFENATLFASDPSEPALALAGLYRRQGKLRKAIDTLRLAVSKNQRSASLNLALAGMLRRRTRRLERRKMPIARRKVIEEARRCYRTSMQSELTSECCLQYGNFEQELGNHEAAASLFRQASELDPDSVAVLAQLAHCSVDQGEIESGLELFEYVLTKAPESAISHFRYTRAKRFRPGDATSDYLIELRRLLADEQRPEIARIHLHFALAKVLDDVGDYDHAWEHYDRANRLKPSHSQTISTRSRERIDDGGRPLQKGVDMAVGTFCRDYFLRHAGDGVESDRPIFIVGMPRSGTTLTEQILSSHPDVAGAGELKWIDRLQRDYLWERDSITGGAAHSTSHSEANNTDDVHNAKSIPDTPSPARRGTFESILPRLASLPNDEIQRIGEQYLRILDGYRSGERHVSDKMPTNFVHLGMIARMFPRATVIQCQRNPMDILVSNYCQHLSAPFCDLDQLVAYYEEYCRLMAHWRSVLPIPIHAVRYERLIADPENETRSLVSHCGLPWNDACLSFHQNKRAVHTPSKWQVRQPLYATSVEKWRRFEPHLHRIVERLEQSSDWRA